MDISKKQIELLKATTLANGQNAWDYQRPERLGLRAVMPAGRSAVGGRRHPVLHCQGLPPERDDDLLGNTQPALRDEMSRRRSVSSLRTNRGNVSNGSSSVDWRAVLPPIIAGVPRRTEVPGTSFSALSFRNLAPNDGMPSGDTSFDASIASARPSFLILRSTRVLFDRSTLAR